MSGRISLRAGGLYGFLTMDDIADDLARGNKAGFVNDALTSIPTVQSCCNEFKVVINRGPHGCQKMRAA